MTIIIIILKKLLLRNEYNKEVTMQRVFKRQNGTVYVTLSKSCDDILKRATENFLKKVMNGEKNYGDSNTTNYIRKE